VTLASIYLRALTTNETHVSFVGLIVYRFSSNRRRLAALFQKEVTETTILKK
jgi:hypothetical protein